MALTGQHENWKSGLKISLAIALFGIITFSEDYAFAQSNIVADDTLAAEGSVVIPNFGGLPVEAVDGGAIRGTNLFHSFQEFNVSEGRGAYFLSPGGEIQNIFARVTGSNRSEILGTLGTLGNSNPNLFLINPNGIIFGANASLDVRGSFVGTTANAVQLGDAGLFSASEPATSNLLTVNPSALFFNTLSSQGIVNRSTASSTVLGTPTSGLRVSDGRSLLLVGGNINLEGGILRARGGRVDVGGLAGAGRVELAMDGNNLGLSFPQDVQLADVSLTKEALINVNGVEGGIIQMQGRHVALADESALFANTFGNPNGRGIFIRAEHINMERRSVIGAITFGAGQGGDVMMETKTLTVRDGSQIGTVTTGSGQAGNLTVTASESVELKGTFTNGVVSGLFAQSEGAGNAGNLRIETGQLILQDGGMVLSKTFAQGDGGDLSVLASDFVELVGETPDNQVISSGLFATSEGTGDAGDLTVETRRLIVRDGAQVVTSSFKTAKSGNLTVIASEAVELSGTGLDEDGISRSSSGLFARSFGTGAAGNLRVITGALIVRDGARASASTNGGQGGKLTVTASESVEVTGIAANGEFNSGLFTQTVGTGDAGELTIETGRLRILNGAQISASTSSEGEGGTIDINASESVEAIGQSPDGQFDSIILAETSGSGMAGSVEIATGQLIVRDGAEVTVSSLGLGKAGILNVEADSIFLFKEGKLTGETASGLEGNITLQVQDLILMRNNSAIATSAENNGNGGNITIDTPFIVAVPAENSDILADAERGSGGQIDISATGIYGLEFREQLTSESDITASSKFGVDGVVTINTPEIDPSRGLVNLPTDLVDASNQIARNCSGGGAVAQNRFVLTGRGGMPPNPGEPLSNDTVWTDLRTASAVSGSTGEEAIAVSAVTPQPPNPNPQLPIVEATGWMTNNKGEVILTAAAPTLTTYGSTVTTAQCDRF